MFKKLQTATNALFDLAIRPEYVEPLRAEIEEVVAAHGWTKEAMGHLVKLDSFMKESSRLAGISVCKWTGWAHEVRVLTHSDSRDEEESDAGLRLLQWPGRPPGRHRLRLQRVDAD